MKEAQLGSPQLLIEAQGLSLADLRMKAYQHVDLQLEAGKCHAICAQDKGGKTELLLTLAGFMRPTEGTCTVAQHEVSHVSGRREIRKIASLSFFEHVNDVERDLRVRTIASAELGLSGKPSNRAAAQAFLTSWGLEAVSDCIVEDLPRYEYDLLGIALGMAHDPQLLLVDDIETDLTSQESLELRSLLLDLSRDRHVTVVCGVLDLELAAGFDTLTCITNEDQAQRIARRRKHLKSEVA